MHVFRIFTALCGAVVAGAFHAAPASAHPHVFAEARLELSINPDGTVKSLRHVWRFDDFFSSTVLIQFDKNKDLKLEKPELEALAKTVRIGDRYLSNPSYREVRAALSSAADGKGL